MTAMMGGSYPTMSAVSGMTSLVAQTAVIAILIYIVTKAWTLLSYMRRHGRLFADYPGPKENHWLLGTFKFFPTDKEKRLTHFIDICEPQFKNGYTRIWLGFNRPLIIVHSPHTMRKILKTAEPKPTGLAGGYRMIQAWIGDGLLVSGGAKWARNRRLLTPAFHFDVLKPYMDLYNRATDVLVEKLDKHASVDEKFEVFQYICNCSLDIILKCAFSFDEDVQTTGTKNPYVAAVTELSFGLDYRSKRPWLFPDVLYNLSPAGRAFKKNADFVHTFAESVIDKRRKALAEGGDDHVRKTKYLDFLDILLTARDENGQGLTPLDMRNEVDTFLFEGHDTTASGMSWILYSLAKHPEIQRRAQEEVDTILDGRDSDDIEWSDLSNMEYLTMCIKEGLRLHAPVSMVARQLTQDLDFGDRVIPKGTPMQINIWALHHNRHVWGDNHWDYDPERFSKVKVTEMDHYQFVPFSAGPRYKIKVYDHVVTTTTTSPTSKNCIGQHFAMNEIKVVIAKLLRAFTFKLDETHVVKRRLALVMRSETGMYMYATRRRH